MDARFALFVYTRHTASPRFMQVSAPDMWNSPLTTTTPTWRYLPVPAELHFAHLATCAGRIDLPLTVDGGGARLPPGPHHTTPRANAVFVRQRI